MAFTAALLWRSGTKKRPGANHAPQAITQMVDIPIAFAECVHLTRRQVMECIAALKVSRGHLSLNRARAFLKVAPVELCATKGSETVWDF